MAVAFDIKHRNRLATSTALAECYVQNFIAPLEVIRVLNAAKIRFMLVGAHGLAGWLHKARATEDVDVVVGYRYDRKAARALLGAFPFLEEDNQEVVIRLRDRETGEVAIDVMKSNQPLYREALKHTRVVNMEGQTYRIPSLEMALATKFAPMVSLVRGDLDKRQDAIDFARIVRANPEIDLEQLAQFGELVYPGGGKEIVELVQNARAGKTLQI